MDGQTRRRKRAAGDKKKYLEVLVVADHTITAMHGKDRVKNYIMTLMNIANSVYQHHTLGLNIRVVVTEIVLLDKDDQKRVLTKKDAYRTVQQFCQWSMHRLSPMYAAKHDVAILLTRESLGPAGYAPITGLCDPSRSCAAITDEGFTTGFIIAHETAHIFGLFHDGHGNSCTGRRYTTAVMAPLVEAKLNHYWWSECSKQRMHEVINYLYCLNDEPNMVTGTTHYDLDSGSSLRDDIGKDYSLQFQCRLEFGHDFILCAAFEQDSCNMLWCSERKTPHMCRTKRGPPLPGSSCGHYRQCRNSQCIYVGNEKPVHGGWSDWEEWGSCSVDCGVGIRRRRRSCTKPQPAYGGKDCDGNAEDWDTCMNKDCSQYQDSREAHCAVWNDLNIRSGYHVWLPYQSSKESDRCKQTCVSNQTGEVIVTIDIEISDGTSCTYEEPYQHLLSWLVFESWCDGLRNSTMEYDSCGVCGGNNSECKTVSGHFNRAPSSREEYESVVLLPKGCRNIEIVKRGINKHFVALRDPRYGTFPLNGDKRRGSSRDFIFGGARFVYKTVNFIESIKSSGPLYNELEVMLYPNKDNTDASVTYEYTVNRQDMTLEKRKYQWKFHNWTACSVTCGDGVMNIEHACFDKDSGLEVSKDSCQYLEPPRRNEVPCHAGSCTMTRYTWAMTNDWSLCNASECGGKGEETQGYKCELYYMNNDTYEQADMDLCDIQTAQ
ncbi:LOW QUALITY PROTEIN: A disintegrin and metalloproteinase with thrombospondin motifs 3-like [Pomacea canaliculata]|uniref:LOW QUALITY PROTEIN: A disintegrin and metalloproteinase with thrombospondin motifs 3-like n=1 Tax=Pomacea canaliculata TaxID=400727 RepID=UPI000D729EA5|nr:LOW QUALITY PROTEIN: A disintegrin and metalloproteinase with thrombospondin motifs 3-like [Pomacea canaliculata]